MGVEFTINALAIGKGKDIYIYKDARKNIENGIQTATTVNSNLKKLNMIE